MEELGEANDADQGRQVEGKPGVDCVTRVLKVHHSIASDIRQKSTSPPRTNVYITAVPERINNAGLLIRLYFPSTLTLTSQ